MRVRERRVVMVAEINKDISGKHGLRRIYVYEGPT